MPTPQKRPRGKTANLDWPAIRLAFVNGSMSPLEHARTHKVEPAAMRQRVKRGEWMAERHRLSELVTSKAQEAATTNKVAELAARDKADGRISRLLHGLALRMIVDAARPGVRKLTPTEARTIASLAESAQKIGRIALGGSTENTGHMGVPGGAPILTAAATPAAVTQAMRDYLAGN